jgi:hypothetical protein
MLLDTKTPHPSPTTPLLSLGTHSGLVPPSPPLLLLTPEPPCQKKHANAGFRAQSSAALKKHPDTCTLTAIAASPIPEAH